MSDCLVGYFPRSLVTDSYSTSFPVIDWTTRETVLNARIYLATNESPIVVEVRKFNMIMMVMPGGGKNNHQQRHVTYCTRARTHIGRRATTLRATYTHTAHTLVQYAQYGGGNASSDSEPFPCDQGDRTE
jgi:hypothetical protein